MKSFVLKLFQRSVCAAYALALSLLVLTACGGSGGGSIQPPPPPPPPPPTITSVTVTPKTSQLRTGDILTFTAKVEGTGPFNSAVTWMVNDIPGGNATLGTISPAGAYTAPSNVPTPNPVTITGRRARKAVFEMRVSAPTVRVLRSTAHPVRPCKQTS